MSESVPDVESLIPFRVTSKMYRLQTCKDAVSSDKMDFICKFILEKGIWEPYVNSVAFKLVYDAPTSSKNKSLVIDVGAHIGVYSVVAAAAGAKRVVAFESQDLYYGALQETIASNRFKRTITPHKKQVVERGFESDTRVSIDAFIGDEKVLLLKVDVGGGHEAGVLLGASHALANNQIQYVLMQLSSGFNMDVTKRVLGMLMETHHVFTLEDGYTVLNAHHELFPFQLPEVFPETLDAFLEQAQTKETILLAWSD